MSDTEEKTRQNRVRQQRFRRRLRSKASTNATTSDREEKRRQNRSRQQNYRQRLRSKVSNRTTTIEREEKRIRNRSRQQKYRRRLRSKVSNRTTTIEREEKRIRNRSRQQKYRQRLRSKASTSDREEKRRQDRSRQKRYVSRHSSRKQERNRLEAKRYRLRKRLQQEDATSESDSSDEDRRQQHNSTANEARDRARDNESLQQSESRRRYRTNQDGTRRARGTKNSAIQSLSDVDEDEIQEQDCGEMSEVCGFCRAKHFRMERPSDRLFTVCCHKGKVRPPLLQRVPAYIYNIFTRNSRTSTNFLENIRKYNNAFAMASMGGNIQHLPPGPPCFKIQGTTYHRVSALHPEPKEPPRFAQLYILDPLEALNNRLDNPMHSGCEREVLRQIGQLMRRHNTYAKSYQAMHEVEEEARVEAIREGIPVEPVYMDFVLNKNMDRRRYNVPTVDTEVAIIFQANEDGEPPHERDLRIYPRGKNKRQVSIISPLVDPLTYPMFFFMGDAGWHVDLQQSHPYTHQDTGKRMTQLEFYSHRIAVRDEFNPILRGRRLFQQFIVDVFIRIEGNRLNYIRHNQPNLMVENYSGLQDHVQNLATNKDARTGKMVILPSSFTGGPRAMVQLYQDAMSVVAKLGKPDLFITMTCNKNWNEITSNLFQGQIPEDRPDLLSRVFRMKLKTLLEDITKKDVLGKVAAFVYTIEFQKRGLPHAHILIILETESKLRTSDDYNNYVSAEIPDQRTQPRLYSIVTKFMVHNPCGAINGNPHAPCLDADGNCTKNFPKDFETVTKANQNGYPIYRRRRGRYYMARRKDGSGHIRVDNRWVVPYNPFLLLKYNCHINVEVCSSVKSIKYIYKYIYKGMDGANVRIHQDAEQNQQRTLNYDEVEAYLNCRYLSSIEAAWRLFAFPLHDQSHSIIRLDVHLEREQNVTHTTGNEERALQNSGTTLTAWLALNGRDPEAREYTYTEIPYHYTYYQTSKIWRPRLRMGKIIPRMYSVSPSDVQRYALRLLLLSVKGVSSFAQLRTFENITYPTFQEAARARGLLQDDRESEKCLEEAQLQQMPPQMRQMFAFLLIFVSPANSLDLWNKFKDSMSEDFDHDPQFQPQKYDYALADIQETLQLHQKTLQDFSLPEPLPRTLTEVAGFNLIEESAAADENEARMNPEQFIVHHRIMAAYNNSNVNEGKCFFIDAAGGTGKTFVANTILHRVRGLGGVAIACASTGIAATLFPKGSTAHSVFGIPVPVCENSVANIKLNTPQADFLTSAKFIFWDEGTMANANSFKVVDRLLQFLKKTKAPFGGIPFVVAGDFRQTLPIVKRGGKTQIVEACLKSSSLWQHFKVLRLTQNMRTGPGEGEFAAFLLRLGNGEVELHEDLGSSLIQIPEHLLSSGDLIQEIFQDTIANGDIGEISKRVILCPKNKEAFEINEKIQEQLPGTSRIYLSVDEVSTDVETDVTYSTEFLNAQTPSGMPQHRLELKVGSIVMLLRNLSTEKGLCNGTRLIVEKMLNNFIVAKILTGSSKNKIVYIPRITLNPSDTNLPFQIKRRQFPLRLSFAMTVNKSQGQTFDRVGMYLPEPVFGHGQLYVGLSRATTAAGVKVKILTTSVHGQVVRRSTAVYTKNIVYREILI